MKRGARRCGQAGVQPSVQHRGRDGAGGSARGPGQPPEPTPFSARRGRRCRCRNFVRVVATGADVQHRSGRNWLPPERSAEGLAGLGWTGPRGCLNEAAFSSSAGVMARLCR
jgi:hypothetical protein